MPSEEELAARRRIEEEANKVISRTRLSRKLQQQELIGGENAEEIHLRKDRVEIAKKNWSIKGTEGQSHGAEAIELNLAEKAKRDYEENLKKFNEKGKPPMDPIMDSRPLSPEVTKRFVKPTTDLPTLFGSKVSIKQPKDSQASNGTNYSDEFSKIEKVEEKIVGNSKHITTIGIDQAGRRVTKTKIILPEQVGATKAQHQQGTTNTTESEKNVTPPSWDGTFYSLTDIRQNKVAGIDKNNRERYLSPQEFEDVFHMTKEEFSKMPKWKRDNMKRDLHLF
jgi:Villin headpiece domain